MNEPGAKKTVLVVEDNPVGFLVIQADSGEAALRVLQEQERDEKRDESTRDRQG